MNVPKKGTKKETGIVMSTITILIMIAQTRLAGAPKFSNKIIPSRVLAIAHKPIRYVILVKDIHRRH